MNAILRKLTNEMYNNENNYYARTIGNYRVVRNLRYIYHYYYGNRICLVDLDKKQFSLFNCGYEKYPLTTAQLNFLEKFYKNKTFELVYRGN